MNRYAFLLFLSFFLIGCEQATQKERSIDQAQQNMDIEEVQHLVEQSFQGIWSDLDTNAIHEYHTEDFLLLENGMVWNNDTIANYLEKERKEMEREQYQRLNRFEFLRAKHRQTSVWLAYHNYGTWVKGADTLGSAHWLESVIAIKDGGQWKLEQMHSTRIRK